MFRRLPDSLPPDPSAPDSLQEMGYFVDENDQIRMIRDPERSYQFKIDRNNRVNEVHRAAMNERVREIVQRRLLDLGMRVLRIPTGVSETDRHVPIYISQNLRETKRVLVVFGARDVDAGIFSFRAIGTEGIDVGSATRMTQAIVDKNENLPDTGALGLLIANPCQLIWHRGGGKAVGDKEWLGLARASAVHEPFRIDEVQNRIPGNADFTEHVHHVFEHIMNGQTHPSAVFDIIGMEYTGMAVMHYLAAYWNRWKDRINGVCLGNPQHTLEELCNISEDNKEFLDFVKKRSRGYMVSDAPLETPVATIERVGCNCYSSGEQYYEDGILVKGWRSMLDWFDMISTIKDYEEPTLNVIESQDEDEVMVAQGNEAW